MQTSSIPRFALYGETGQGDEPAFVHIETIRQRSAQHDWEIRPHRHGYFHQILFVCSGDAQVSIDGQNQTIAGPSLVIVPPGTVHGFRFDPSVEGKVLTLSADFVHRAAGAADPLGRFLGQPQILPLDEPLKERLDRLAEEMLLAQSDHSDTRMELLLALAEAWTRLAAHRLGSAGQGNGQDARAGDLLSLIERHFREQKSVGFYADALGMTTRTLSRVTQRLYDCSPQELLHRRLVLEASRLLLYTNATSVQIAGELGFADPSYFSRFYLRMTGDRPQLALARRQHWPNLS